MLPVPWKHSLVRKQFCQVSFFSDHAISFLLFQSILSMLSQSVGSVCFEKKEAKNRGTIFFVGMYLYTCVNDRRVFFGL